MPQVPRVTIKDRARRLREKGEAALRGHLDPQIGAHRLVLTERGGIGRTEQFTPVLLNARRWRRAFSSISPLPIITGGNYWRPKGAP